MAFNPAHYARMAGKAMGVGVGGPLGGAMGQVLSGAAVPRGADVINRIASGLGKGAQWAAEKASRMSSAGVSNGIGGTIARGFGAHHIEPIRSALKTGNYLGKQGVAEQVGRFMLGSEASGSLLHNKGWGNAGRIVGRGAALGAVGGLVGGTGVIGGAFRGATAVPRVASNAVLGTDW